jgi:hypothetical protein
MAKTSEEYPRELEGGWKLVRIEYSDHELQGKISKAGSQHEALQAAVKLQQQRRRKANDG